MPLFSIVIPTRNRAHLLARSLRTAVAQTFGDYEVVVSDNHSSDATASVTREVGDRRVRYVRTDGPLCMPDSWEFAMAQARGEYVTYLCDDDAITPRTLERARRALERFASPVVMWGGASYYDASWPGSEWRNTLVVPTHTGRVVELESASLLRALYGLRYGRTPMLVNCACRGSIVEEVKRKAGRFFIGASPDYAAGIAMLAHVSRITFIDRILSVGGGSVESTGMTTRFHRGEAFQRAIQELGERAALRRVPLPIHVQTAYLAEQFLLLQEVFVDELRPYALDWVQFFVNCHVELDIYERNGVDVSDDRREFAAALAKQPEAVQRRVRERLEAHADASERPARRLDAAALGIRDIVDCARYLDRVRRTLKGVVKGAIVSMFGGSRGFRVARSLGAAVERLTGRTP